MNFETITSQINTINLCLREINATFEVVLTQHYRYSKYTVSLRSIIPNSNLHPRPLTELLIKASTYETHTLLRGLGKMLYTLAIDSSPITNEDLMGYTEYLDKMADKGIHAIEFSDWKRGKQKLIEQNNYLHLNL